jgi:hypothetical protein
MSQGYLAKTHWSDGLENETRTQLETRLGLAHKNNWVTATFSPPRKAYKLTFLLMSD